MDDQLIQERLFTVPEAAKHLRLAPSSVWQLLRLGRLARTKVSGKTFVRASELQRLIVDRINCRAVS